MGFNIKELRSLVSHILYPISDTNNWNLDLVLAKSSDTATYYDASLVRLRKIRKRGVE